jgi:hypothetical protein
MSALADIVRRLGNVRFVPLADISIGYSITSSAEAAKTINLIIVPPRLQKEIFLKLDSRGFWLNNR